MLQFGRWGILVGLLILVATDATHAAIVGLQRVATGLSAPIFVTHAPGDRTRLFIGQRGGSIRILNLTTGSLETTPFLSIPNVDQAGEGGLRGIEFHPDYATNGKFYVNVTIDNGGQVFQGATSPFSTHIRQYTVSANPNIANTTPTEILSFIQPQDNHNAGWIGFSPNNGLLYIPTGDGGGGGGQGEFLEHDHFLPRLLAQQFKLHSGRRGIRRIWLPIVARQGLRTGRGRSPRSFSRRFRPRPDRTERPCRPRSADDGQMPRDQAASTSSSAAGNWR